MLVRASAKAKPAAKAKGKAPLKRGYPDLQKPGQGKWLQNAIAKSDAFYQKWGWWAVVIGRFMPWARVFVPVIAGVARMNYYKFFSANAVGAVAWGIGLTVTGFFAATIPAVKNASYLIALFFVIASMIAGLRNWRANRR